MFYCFVEQDFCGLGSEHPLTIQANYAKRLGMFCSCDLSNNGVVRDYKGESISVMQRNIFLRSGYGVVSLATKLLAGQGARLLETASDVGVVEHWDSLALTKREIVAILKIDVLNGVFSPQCEAFLKRYPFVFLKSRKKGFTAQVRSEKLLSGDRELLDFLERQPVFISNELLLSKLLEVKRDSLGRRESRHFVMNGVIVNSSRAVRAIRHTVPRKQIEAATAFVEHISQYETFPKNYVIDIGDFEDEGTIFTDIVEINPISSALCYVNNSIFDVLVPEIEASSRKMGMGAEYCYDALRHPEYYTYSRLSNACYEYVDPEHYSFV